MMNRCVWCDICYQVSEGLKTPAAGKFDLFSLVQKRWNARCMIRVCLEHLTEARDAGYFCIDLTETSNEDTKL